MKKPTSSTDNANFTKIADLLEAPYMLRSKRAALKLVIRKKAEASSVAIVSDSGKLAA